jgi:hypothetical protein
MVLDEVPCFGELAEMFSVELTEMFGVPGVRFQHLVQIKRRFEPRDSTLAVMPIGFFGALPKTPSEDQRCDQRKYTQKRNRAPD